MADGLSIAASVIAVAGLAYSSSKMLYQFIADIHDAPKTFLDLNTDIEALYKTIYSLKQELNDQDKATALSEAQKSNLREIEPSLEGCRDACNEFKGKLDKLMSHSKGDYTSIRDRVKLQFKDKEISAFRMRLGSYKSTLAIALEFSSFKTTSQNLDATKALETKIEDVTARLTGQMQGLQIGLQAFLDAGAQSRELITTAPQRELAEAQESKVLLAIEQQNIALGHCYRACMAAFKETTQATGHTYKYVEASNEARLLAGDFGNVPAGVTHSFEKVIAKDKARVVAGNMDGQYAKDFFK